MYHLKLVIADAQSAQLLELYATILAANIEMFFKLLTVGPPIVIPIGAVLEDGSVYLNDGIEIKGAFFESTDRRLYENGTIVYKLTNTQEKGKVTYALLDSKGNLDYLPRLGDTPTSMTLFRRLNIKPASRHLNIRLENLDINDEDWSTIKESATDAINGKRRKKRMTSSEISKTGILRQALSLANLVTRIGVSAQDSQVFDDILCLAAKRVHDQQTRNAVIKFKPHYACFYENILNFCLKDEN